MPRIVFDPDGELETCFIPKKGGRYLKGGSLSSAKRCEYMRLCLLITSRDPSLNYTELRDQILAIMKEDVIHHIQTLPEADRPALLADIEQFYSTIDPSDNPFTIINIIALQTTVLFTQYLEDPEDKRKYHMIYSEYDYLQFTKDDSWKSYTEIKEKLSSSEYSEFQFLISNSNPSEGIDSSEPIFLAFLGFLTLRELIETIMNHVVFCALTYTIEAIDGQPQNPMVTLWHDTFHYGEFQECLKYPSLLKEFKEFQKFVVETQEKSIQYAVHLVFFAFLHELPYCYRFDETGNSLNSPFFKEITPEFIQEQLNENMENFVDLESQGKAIPKAYRELEEGSTKLLKEERVQEYLKRASQLYVNAYKEFEASKHKNKNGGKRRTRKRRIRPRKRHSTRSHH
jgi:hypothetical protein